MHILSISSRLLRINKKLMLGLLLLCNLSFIFYLLIFDFKLVAIVISYFFFFIFFSDFFYGADHRSMQVIHFCYSAPNEHVHQQHNDAKNEVMDSVTLRLSSYAVEDWWCRGPQLRPAACFRVSSPANEPLTKCIEFQALSSRKVVTARQRGC